MGLEVKSYRLNILYLTFGAFKKERIDDLKLTPSLEDYLKAIYILSVSKREVRPSDIAELMSVRLPSVSEAIKRLMRMGLIQKERYGNIILTRQGYELALNLLRRHQIIARFLQEFLGLSPEDAHREACIIEHSISEETLTRLNLFVEVFLRYCRSCMDILLNNGGNKCTGYNVNNGKNHNE